MIGIAVVECGRIDAMHATDIAVHPRFRLAVQDINGAAAQTDTASTGASVIHAAVEVFSSPDVDAVLLTTAPDAHVDLLEQAVAAGKPVLCEKSIDPSLVQSKGMAASENRRPRRMLLSGKRRMNHAAPLVHFFAERGRRALVLAEVAIKSIANGHAVKVSELG
jgi:myo-inositol 2-dehydrogenase / D-chiro-inositol 1-dehydrogenase